MCHQGVQDDPDRLQEPGAVREGGCPFLQGRVQETESSQDHEDLGREGGNKSEEVSGTSLVLFVSSRWEISCHVENHVQKMLYTILF